MLDASQKQQQPTINFQYFQPRPPPRDKPLDTTSLLPLYTQGLAYPPQYMYPNFGYSAPAWQLPPIIKNIQISTDGPTANHQRLAIIHEDALPAKPFVPSSTTVGERLNIYQFVRSSIFNNSDGQNINLDGGSSSSLYGGGGDDASLLSFVKFGDLNPYNIYRSSPNPYMGLPDGFLIYRSCYPIRHQESGSSTLSTTMCARDSTGVNIRIYKLLEGSFLVNRLNPKLFSSYDEWRELAFYEYIREFIIKKKECPHFVTLFGFFISEKSGIDFDAIDMIKYNKKGSVEPMFTSRPELDIDKIIKSELDFDVVRPEILETKKETKDMIIRATDSILSGTAPETIKYVDKTTNSIMQINPKAYTGKALVMLTESPTYSIFGWATKTYQGRGNVKEMINRGFHTSEEWMNVMFQTMVALYVMQIHKLYIRNMNPESSIMIKDLTLRGPITNYWKYIIDDMEFYLPNLGYLVLLDSNFRDLKNMQDGGLTFGKSTHINTNTSKVDGKFLNEYCKLTDVEINDKVFEMFKRAFDVNLFDKEFEKSGGCKPPADILSIYSQISLDISSDTTKDIKKYIIRYMKKFLNNRVGTYLRETEIANIRREDTRGFKKGQLIVHEDGFGSYKFVLFVSPANNENVVIMTKDDSGEFTENTVHVSSLINYSKSEPIAQTFKQNEANMNEDDLLETYIIKG